MEASPIGTLRTLQNLDLERQWQLAGPEVVVSRELSSANLGLMGKFRREEPPVARGKAQRGRRRWYHLFFPGWASRFGLDEKTVVEAHRGESGIVVSVRFAFSSSLGESNALDWHVVKVRVGTDQVDGLCVQRWLPIWLPRPPGEVAQIEVLSMKDVVLFETTVKVQPHTPTVVAIRAARMRLGKLEPARVL